MIIDWIARVLLWMVDHGWISLDSDGPDPRNGDGR